MQSAAKARAKQDMLKFHRADLRYGGIISSTKGDAPRLLGVAHILRVNPGLSSIPEPTSTSNGFMYASIDQARNAGLVLGDMIVPLKCAFAWSNDINLLGKDLQTTNPLLFVNPDTDFWQTAYLRQTLGDATFKTIWNATTKTAGASYTALLAYIQGLKTPPGGWTLPKLQKLVLVDCEYVRELWTSQGQQHTEGFGRVPRLTSRGTTQVFLEST
jgi:hypothetical protein